MSAARLPSVKARDVIRALLAARFAIVRSSGSHYRLLHDTDPTRKTTVPVHGGKDIPRGTLHEILKQAGLTVGEFLDLL